MKKLSILIALFALVACQNVVNYDKDYVRPEDAANTAAPIIKAVYLCADVDTTTAITEAERGAWLRIVGTNLNHPTAILFNDAEVPASDIATGSTYAIVRVPAEARQAVDSRIRYTTALGTATLPFAITWPSLEVKALYCEFVSPGDTLLLTGRNFDAYDFAAGEAKVTLGNAVLKVVETTPTTLQAIVPADAADNQTLTVNWTEQGEAHAASFPFRPTEHLLFGDMETRVTLTANDAAQAVPALADEVAGAEKMGRKHMHLTGTLTEWSWNTVDIKLTDCDDTRDLTEVSKYNFCFEVLTPCGVVLENTMVAFQLKWGAQYEWLSYDNEADFVSTAGHWQTITLPLEDIATNGGVVDQWKQVEMHLIFKPSVESQLDLHMANFRIVEK